MKSNMYHSLHQIEHKKKSFKCLYLINLKHLKLLIFLAIDYSNQLVKYESSIISTAACVNLTGLNVSIITASSSVAFCSTLLSIATGCGRCNIPAVCRFI